MSVTPQPCKDNSPPEGNLCLPSQPVTSTVPVETQQPPVPPEPLPTPTNADLQLADLPLWALAAFAVLLLTIAILGYVLVRLARPAKPASKMNRSTSTPDHRSGPQPVLNSNGYQALLQAFIGTYDLTASEVVHAHIQKSLRGVGITPITPRPGDAFDLGLHNGVSGVSAPSPNMAHRIVRVLRPGWRSDHEVLRLADVEVYKE